MRTAVIVLGDLGRSPRMQYHAASLAAAGHDVDLVGLEGAEVMPVLAANPRVRCHRLPDHSFKGRAKGGTKRFVFGSLARAVGQARRLWVTLMRAPKADVILVQNPPAVPTLAVAWLVARLRGSCLVIDWHNLSHTVAAIRLGERHRAVKAVARSERRWARRADGHLAVSKALATWLSGHYGITASVVYDRPPAAFSRPAPSAAVAMWTKLAQAASLGADRLPLVVCPTSWTPDEDFDLLLEALERAERQLSRRGGSSAFAPGASADKLDQPAPADPPVPLLAVILTGKGALRESFEARLARRSFSFIAVRTQWLEPEDYPVLIGMADLGLCLHQSSSGLDLPMKVADFRGAGVPVAAFDYAPVLGEVLTPGHEGLTFRDPGDLAAVLVEVASRSADPASALSRSRAWLFENPAERWDTEWQSTALPVLRE
ncbi:MAG: glycosyltransferase [Acidobacteriota bacterium]|nr:glycosyltransferase [Acidobacteriota bacterium]